MRTAWPMPFGPELLEPFTESPYSPQCFGEEPNFLDLSSHYPNKQLLQRPQMKGTW